MLRTLVSAVLVSALLACGPDKAAQEARARAEAEALAAETKQREQAEARKRERERKQREEQEAKAALDAQIDALAVLPQAVPKNLEKACKGMVKAYDAYMRKVLTGDQLTKWETGGNEMQVTVFKRECMKFNPQVAACQQHAFEQAPPALSENIADFMRACGQKFKAAE